MTNEQEQFERELAELEAEFGPENVSIMGRHSIKYLTLIYENKEYQPKEEENMEREVRLSLDQIERSLRDTKVIDDGDVITEARIEPGELVVKVVKEEENNE